MTNTLKRRSVSYTVPEVKAVAAQPAYSYFVTETIQLSSPSYSNAPSGWGYRQVTDNEGNVSIQLVYLGTLAAGTGVYTTVPSGSSTTTTRTYRVDVPAVEAVEGSPAYRVDDPPQGWTTFAHSDASIPGAGRAEFSVASDCVGVAIGLSSSGSPTSGYSHIPQGVLLTGGKVKNLRTGEYLDDYTVDDVLEMALSRTTVSFLKNGELLASEDSTYAVVPLFLSAVLYATGDYVTNPVLEAAYGGTSEASLPALTVSANEDNFTQATASLPELVLTGRVGNRGSGSLPALEGLASEKTIYAQAMPSFSALKLMAYGGTLAVELNQGAEMTLPALLGAGLMLVGETATAIELLLPEFDGIAADHAYGEAITTLPAMYAVGYNEPANEGFMVETLDVDHPLSGITELVAIMLDGVLVTATYTATELMDALMQELITAAPNWATSAFLEAVMYAFVHSGSSFSIPGVGDETWVFNVDAGGSSSYSNFEFNSYAKIGDKYYGASPNGIFELDGDTDDGAPIRAVIGLGKRDFGSAMRKTISHAYIGMSATGNLFLKVIAEGAEYIYKTRDFSAEMQQQRISCGKGLKSNYVWLDIYNEGGADFEIDTVEFHVADLSRRIK